MSFIASLFFFSFRQAKAMYSCKAEHSHELSFPQGAIFSNGKICFTLTYILKKELRKNWTLSQNGGLIPFLALRFCPDF